MKLKNLKTDFLGRNVIYYKTIDSTQSEIWRLIEKENLSKSISSKTSQNTMNNEYNVPNGTIVMADIQTAGQGTHGRVWHTDQENNIAFSFLIKPNCNIKNIEGITIKTAETIVKVMNNMYGIDLDIKFPNDIYYNNKKMGGILTQSKVINETVKYLVIGIGINTLQQEFAEDVKDIATSIKNEFGVDVNVCEFITEFCNEFAKLGRRIF